MAFLAPGFQVRLLVNYRESPVGPYLEHALAGFGWRGPSVVQMSVDSEASLRGGRENWGFPKVMETLGWSSDKRHIHFQRENQRFIIRKTGLRFPVALPFWTVQNLQGKPVMVPATIRSWARIGFRGRQLAIILEDFEMTFAGPEKL